MKNFYKALLVACLLPILSFGQSNYKPGYVVTLKGDTLRGFIDYKEWNASPTAINFKTVIADSKSRKLTPEEIKFFNVNGLESYQRYTGPISMDATDVNHINNGRDTSFRTATVFFKVLQKGANLALYSYTDDLKLRLYVGESPRYVPVELGYRIYYNYGAEASGQQRGATVNENTYMRQLFGFANKYQVLDNDLQASIEHTGYNGDGVLKIVSKVNHISKAEYQKAHTSGAHKFNLFLGVAANIDNMTTSASSPYYNAGGRSVTSINPAVSFGINLFANPSTRQLQFRLELSANQSHYKSLYDSKVDPQIPTRASFDEFAFSFAPQLIYNFYNAENFKVYGGVGVVFSFFNFSNSYLGSQAQPNSATDIQTNNPYQFNGFDNSFLFKAGVQFSKNWGIFGQYESGVGITRNGYWALSSVSEQVGINYFFR
ncbi:MAG TPA: hypothetical protein VGM63_16185 [Mucilaginibacter sp.]